MITLSKIASLASVSVSTASKAFSMSPDVSDETRNMIFDIAKSHGVFKKFYNAKYPKLVVGVVCSNYNNSFFPDILKNIQKKLEEYNCDMCVTSFNTSRDKEQELYEYYSLYTDVDALITIGKTFDLPKDFLLPRVDISPWNIDPKTPTVVMNYEIIGDIIKNFYNKGVKTIGFITPYERSGKAWKFKKFMKMIYGEYDEELIEIVPKDCGECGYNAAENMIKKGRVPRAIFCERDDIAFGAMRAFYENGLNVPKDVAVVGWNNVSIGKYSVPTLSTIHLATNEVISESVSMIIKKLTGQECNNYVEIMSSFIERESSVID